MNVEHLIFDLDNTLYPSSGNMDKGITQRMMNFVASFFDVSYEEAVKIRAEHIRDFSTTLEWLRSEGLTDVESYFSAVHPPYEADELEENPLLRPFLESIRIPKIILTNAPSEHAERVLKNCAYATCSLPYATSGQADFWENRIRRHSEAHLKNAAARRRIRFL